MKTHSTPFFNTMESPITGKPSPTPSAEPLPKTGAMHPILQECLAAGERALKDPEFQANAAAILKRNRDYRSQLSQEKKQPQA
jgi:hypothetical protein